jgi:hypothetical protein
MEALPAGGFAACADTFSTFSAEPAARAATAAAEIVSFLACVITQGGSRRDRGCLRSVSAAWGALVSASLTGAMTSASGAAGMSASFVAFTRQGSTCGVSAGRTR